MKELIRIRNCKSKIRDEARYHDSLLHFKMIRIPIFVATLTISLLILTLGGESAYGQCRGFCFHQPDTSETTVSPKPTEPVNREYTKNYFGSEGATGANQALPIPDGQGVSIGHSTRILPSETILVSQGLSDKFVNKDMYSTERLSENSVTGVDAANGNELNSNPQTSKSNDWEFILIPYGWFTGLVGDITVKGRTADVDAKFLDLADHINIAAMFHGEVWWKGKVGFFGDTTFAKLTADGDISLPNSDSVSINDTTKLFLQEFGALYRAGTWPIGSPENNFVRKSKPSFTVDILAGGRYWYLKNELDIQGPLGILPVEIDGSKHWFDFIVGGRVGLNFYKKLTLEVRTDIGGFGLNFSSDISWNIVSVIAYELPWYRITPIIGFRALYDDYSDGSGDNRFAYNAWMYGPVLGAAFRF